MHCPSLNVLGSFFPSWMLCALLGLGGAIAAALVVRRLGFERYLAPPVVVLPSIALSLACLLWLVRYGA